jgi:thiamine biosynthesis protein ThiS
MEITVNGKSCEYSGQPILCELFRFLGIDPKKVAVERNLKIIPRSLIENEPLEPGDSFEIIRLVGGG